MKRLEFDRPTRRPLRQAALAMAFAIPDATTKTDIEVVHGLADDAMVHPPRAAEPGEAR